MSNTPVSKVVTPVPCRQLSSSLKERLKRCGRYHSSPTTAKRLCTETKCGDNDQPQEMEGTPKRIGEKESTCEILTNSIASLDADKSKFGTFVTPSKGDRSLPLKSDDGKGKTISVDKEIEESSVGTGVSTPQVSKRISECPSVCTETTSPQTLLTPKSIPGKSSVNSEICSLDTQQNLTLTPRQILDSNSKYSTFSTPLSSHSKRFSKVKSNRLNFGFNSPQVSNSDTFRKLENEDQNSNSQNVPNNLNDVHKKPTITPKRRSASPVIASQMKNDNVEEKTITCSNLNYEKVRLTRELTEKSEVLRKLKMVKFYREKNNLTDLKRLIEKWKEVSEQGLQDLHDSLPEPKPTMSDLIKHLQIDANLISYNEEDETFNPLPNTASHKE